MAANGASGESLGGNQIFVTLRRGTAYPPQTVDVRVRYTETVAVLKERVAAATGVPVEQMQARRPAGLCAEEGSEVTRPPPLPQLFWHCKEMVASLYDALTLAQLELHTGFGINGYDLVRSGDGVWGARLAPALRPLRA